MLDLETPQSSPFCALSCCLHCQRHNSNPQKLVTSTQTHPDYLEPMPCYLLLQILHMPAHHSFEMRLLE